MQGLEAAKPHKTQVQSMSFMRLYTQAYINPTDPNAVVSNQYILSVKLLLLPIESADYCMLVNEWAWLTSRVCLLRLEVELASVLESKLGQKWRYGALKACIG